MTQNSPAINLAQPYSDDIDERLLVTSNQHVIAPRIYTI